MSEDDLRAGLVAELLGISVQQVSRLTLAGVLRAEESPWGRLYRAREVAEHLHHRRERALHDRRVRMPPG